MTKNRDLSLDLVRTLAVCQVLTVHFFTNSEFLKVPLTGPIMVVGAVIRTVMMTCVPLFLLLSGYLCGNWRWSRDYYWKGARVLTAYLLSSALCLIWKAVFWDGSLNPLTWVREVLNFNAAPYSWYIEMYLGLFLLIPFINAAWETLEDRGRLALTATMVVLGILPSLLNLSRYTDVQVQLIPGWWEKIYPLAYYCLGRWLREHPLRWRRSLCLVLSLVPAVLGGILHWVKAAGGPLAFLDVTYWNGTLTAISAVLLFSALAGADLSRWPCVLQRGIGTLSRLSLTIYLVSWIPDQVYTRYLLSGTSIGRQLLLGFLLIPVSLLCATLLAWLLSFPEGWILGTLDRLHQRCAENFSIHMKR